MDTIDTVIIGSVFLVFLSIGLAVYYLFFYAKEGEKFNFDTKSQHSAASSCSSAKSEVIIDRI